MNIDRFSGLDQRPGDRPDGALDEALNVIMDSRGSTVRRPGLARVATLPAGTAGLYCIDDVLRAAAPNSTSTNGLAPTLTLDYVEASSGISGRVDAVRLPSGRRLLLIENDAAAGGPALHITAGPAATVRTDSRVQLGSAAGGSFRPLGLVFAEGRAFSLDPDNGTILWSGVADPLQPSGGPWTASTEYIAGEIVTNDSGKQYRAIAPGTTAASGGPTGIGTSITDGTATWTYAGTIGDGWARIWGDFSYDNSSENGGNANVAQSGSSPRALGEYRGTVAVLGLSVVQLYAISGDRGIEGLDQTINGPGVRHQGTLATLSGDLIYADSGGRVRTLSTDTQSAGAGEAALGDPVKTLVEPLVSFNVTPKSVYARALGLYLLAQGKTILALSVLPGQAVLGWSRWAFPSAMADIDAITECRGTVYLRCGTAVYALADNVPDDEVDTGSHFPIAVTVRTVPTDGRGSTRTLRMLSALLSSAATLRILMDGRASASSTLTPTGSEPARRYGAWPARRHSIELSLTSAPAGWRLDGLTLDFGK